MSYRRTENFNWLTHRLTSLSIRRAHLNTTVPWRLKGFREALNYPVLPLPPPLMQRYLSLSDNCKRLVVVVFPYYSYQWLRSEILFALLSPWKISYLIYTGQVHAPHVETISYYVYLPSYINNNKQRNSYNYFIFIYSIIIIIFCYQQKKRFFCHKFGITQFMIFHATMIKCFQQKYNYTIRNLIMRTTISHISRPSDGITYKST